MISAVDFDDVLGWGSAQASAERSRGLIVPAVTAFGDGSVGACLSENADLAHDAQRCEAPLPAPKRNQDFAAITA